MPIYEVRCEACGHEDEVIITRRSQLKGSNKMGCRKCKGMYEIIPSAANFKVKGYNAQNRYSNEKKSKNKT